MLQRYSKDTTEKVLQKHSAVLTCSANLFGFKVGTYGVDTLEPVIKVPHRQSLDIFGVPLRSGHAEFGIFFNADTEV